MKCDIEWRDDIRRNEWDALSRQCMHTTLTQSYAYAQTMREVHKQATVHGIITIDGQRAGIVQMQNVSLFKNIIHFVSIDRGPLWFKDFGADMHTNAFTEALNGQFPARFGRKRRFIPEIMDNNANINVKTWKKSNNTNKYKTFILDISKNDEYLLKKMKKNWRSVLNKAQKESLDIKINKNMSFLGGFLKQYVLDKAQKRYSGASFRLLSVLAKYTAVFDECLLMTVSHNNKIIASILIFQHAHGATYQAGWTTPTGRDKGAHHLLLWQAIIELKKRGVTHFDLGGYNDDTDGIRKFKEGLGGQNMALIGSYY
jgi:lipid II:glycine glycyltransferase (peptidoglycan interpeptide bridge formation enzyme)